MKHFYPRVVVVAVIGWGLTTIGRMALAAESRVLPRRGFGRSRLARFAS